MKGLNLKKKQDPQLKKGMARKPLIFLEDAS
jgi:hypothetical protein